MNTSAGSTPAPNGITGTRTKAETKRQMAARIITVAKAAGINPSGADVRHALDALAAKDRVSDLDVLDRLMRRAPGARKPRPVKRHEWPVSS
ncbi:hypothetical protein [Nocardioides sp.]|uniref:hypothetical protein n=1 Tax=Nocardioides sp. TaxID=35761 RepID=UPI003517C8EB